MPESAADIPGPSAWRFFTGLAGGRPQFADGDMASAIGLLTLSDTGVQSNVTNYRREEYLFRADPPRPRPPSVGEFSVTYFYSPLALPSLTWWDPPSRAVLLHFLG